MDPFKLHLGCMISTILSAGLCLLFIGISQADDAFWTTNHSQGYCAMVGICGKRADGDVLNCASNIPAAAPSEDLASRLKATCPTLWEEQGGAKGTYCCTPEQVDKLSTDTGKAMPFIVGCPACQHNFLHFWCTLTCSPDQATFTNVTELQLAPSNNATVVKTVDHWVTDTFSDDFYGACKDVKFGAANLPAMMFIGGGAKTALEWLRFLGDVKDKRFPPVGSPFQINFHPQNETPAGLAGMTGSMLGCGDPGFTCSCADCPSAPGCEMPAPGPPPSEDTCRVGAMRCWDFTLLMVYLALVMTAAAGLFMHMRKHMAAAAAAGGAEDTEQLHERLLGAARRKVEAAIGADGSSSSGPGDSSEGEEEIETLQGVRYPWLERQLQGFYRRHGENVARNPSAYILAGLLLLAICLAGLTRFRLQTDPQHLWVAPSSQAAQEKARYEDSFGPFYRVEQLILSTTPESASDYISASGLPSIITASNIELLFSIQAEVDAISAQLEEGGEGGAGSSVSLTDICYKPFGSACATQSLLQYWKMDVEFYRAEQTKAGFATKLTPDYCFSHWYTQCRSAFEAPMDPHIVMGGFPVGPQFRNYSADATAFVVTYPVDSRPEGRERALAWEAAFVELAKGKLSAMAAAANLTLSFSSERSVQDELTRESYTDATTVLASYGVMLAYIALALGALPPQGHLKQVFVYSRVGLGLGGVAIVAASVAGALGVCSAFGMWSTLIIMEVIPFLVLAVGVDNMFVLAHALQKQHAALPLATRMGLALAAVGPSITLAASCEVAAFGLGALTSMPAVRNFSICASVAVLLDFLLQMTVFVALLAYDTIRMEQYRVDCAPCVQLPPRGGRLLLLAEAVAPGGVSDVLADAVGNPAQVEGVLRHRSLQHVLQLYIEKLHVPALRQRWSKLLVLLAFTTTAFLSLAALPRVQVGLDQAVALPRDSYLQAYYSQLLSSLRVGPPLFFVVEDLQLSSDVNKVCSVSGCSPDSMLSQISQAARRPDESFIATGAASWLDDFLSWINPALPKCCRAHEADAGQYCPPPDQPPCSTNATACADCHVCLAEMPGGRPDLDQYQAYLPWFLQSVPSEGCAKGGAGAYTDALQADPSDPSGIAGLGEGRVAASAFRAYYKALNHQSDFIDALRAVRAFVDKLRNQHGLRIYSYSVFHIFFEQYLYVARDAAVLLGLPALAMLLACWAFTASLWSSLLLLGTLGSLLLHLAASMYLSGMQMNAVSLVNLAMSLGIAVEFCAHVLHAFSVAQGSRQERADAALRKMGASVLSGITLTKLAGVIVLAFAQTQIFEVYYFRLYLALVVLGVLHGLVLLPVLLSMMGPPSLAVVDEQRGIGGAAVEGLLGGRDYGGS